MVTGDQTTPEGLLEMIADSPQSPPLRDLDVALTQRAEQPETYITPDVHHIAAAGDISRVPDVLLITAPAAVGKSMLARKLSADSGNPLWDLSDFRVGSHFFSGTMARAYGGRGYASLESSLATGSTTLIIDAADEALVRAGLANFERRLLRILL